MTATGVAQTVKGLKERLGDRPVNPSYLAVTREYSLKTVQLPQPFKASLDICLDGSGGILILLEAVTGDMLEQFDVTV